MRRICRAALCLLVIVCAVCAQALAAGEGTAMTLTTSVECADYHFVGNEWTEILFLDGTMVAVYTNDALLQATEEVRLRAGETVNVSAFVLESDNGYPEYGESHETRTITRRDLEKGFDISLDVVVEENAGQYRDQKAVWKVRFSFR